MDEKEQDTSANGKQIADGNKIIAFAPQEDQQANERRKKLLYELTHNQQLAGRDEEIDSVAISHRIVKRKQRVQLLARDAFLKMHP